MKVDYEVIGIGASPIVETHVLISSGHHHLENDGQVWFELEKLMTPLFSVRCQLTVWWL